MPNNQENNFNDIHNSQKKNEHDTFQAGNSFQESVHTALAAGPSTATSVTSNQSDPSSNGTDDNVIPKCGFKTFPSVTNWLIMSRTWICKEDSDLLTHQKQRV